jgi:LCP family protein required for cell wall assembly
MTNQPNKKPLWRRILRIALIVLAILVGIALVLASVFYAIYWRGRVKLLNRDLTITPPESLIDNAEEEGRLITYKGEKYRYNEDVVSLLFLGIDKRDLNTDAVYGNNGQADSLFLATLNTRTGEVKVIPLSRESMVDVNLYDASGNFIGIKRQQLCLAYAYAASAEEGCENICRSVGRLLYGMPIDGYVAIDLNGVKTLNSAVGGIQVKVSEDLEIKNKGEIIRLAAGQTVRLDDNTVLPYVQLRGDDLDANEQRMKRQKQFLNEFIGVATAEIKANFTLLETYYNAAKPYTACNLDFSEITYLTSTYLVGGRSAIQYLTVQGESKLEGEHVAFYPDETSLYEAVLATFYTKE